MALNIVATETPVPVTGRARTSAAADPALIGFYTDTLKPRGVPSSSAVTLRFDTKDEAERDLRALRVIAKKDTPALTLGAYLKAEVDTEEGISGRPHLLTVWVRGLFSPRPERSKDESATESSADEVPAHTEENFASAPVLDVPTFQEPEPEQHGKKHGRFGF